MRRIVVLGLAWVAGMGALSPAFAQGPPPGDTPIEPLGDSASQFYPSKALREEANGWARLRCVPNATGALTDCVVVGEGPAGYGFGRGAMNLSRIARVRADVLPAVAGRPAHFMVGFVVQDGYTPGDAVLSPGREAIEAHRPAGADPIAMASLSCLTPLTGGGALTDCTVQSAGPQGQGLEAAALALAARGYRAKLPPVPPEVQFSLSVQSFQVRDDRPFITRVDNAPVTFVVLKDPALPVSTAKLSPTGVALTCRWLEDGRLQACLAKPRSGGPGATRGQIAATLALVDRLRLVRRVAFNINWGQ
ncbi:MULTISPECIES: hypothetical protein [unclassified Caulobacter]|uniref:hypothetical protein n=1 Tax=unclassified Caulobacter TaxID=2648921 RepID=UPI000D364BCA|nr:MULTISPECIES: hypothetical protein [unclassified Caulobacter]PTS82547.1 hypothetical protein DBR21_17425 [Caulobacter sp. HMWF009]PTT12356.1 hypothetical protein DBR10_01840 [Caulobacter sp. HMWF025]